MKCHTCGAELVKTMTDLPFKRSDTSIVILKALPVFRCTSCSEYLLEDAVMARVEEILSQVDRRAELEIIRFAA